MQIIIVDEDDNEIGEQSFDEVDLSNIIYRVSAVWVSNSKGEVLIAQRALTKKHNPGAWGPSAAGTVEAGETYDENIINELKEEIGVSLNIEELTKGIKRFTHGQTPDRRYFTQWYYITVDKPIEDFVIQKEEVAEIRWVPKDKLLEVLTEKPQDFLDSFPEIIKLIP